VKLSGISSLPVTLKLSEDTRVVYQTIGKLAGLNVLFDPDYTSRPLNIELKGVTLQEALDLVAVESKTFWKPMTGNTVFVAADNPAKRKELEENVIKIFYLSNLTAPAELQDLANTLRTILEVNRVQQVASQQAIVIFGARIWMNSMAGLSMSERQIPFICGTCQGQLRTGNLAKHLRPCRSQVPR